MLAEAFEDVISLSWAQADGPAAHDPEWFLGTGHDSLRKRLLAVKPWEGLPIGPAWFGV